MKLIWPAVLLLMTAVLVSHADETNLTLTVDGVTYSNVTFGTVAPKSVSIRHKTGATTIPLAKLSPELQVRFGYDPQKIAAQEEAQRKAAEAKEAARRKEELLHVQNIGGNVTDVIEGKGVILSNEMFVNSYIQQGGNDPLLTRVSYGFLVCDTKNLVNGSSVSCAAYPDGTYTTSAGMKVNRWVYYGPYDTSKGGTSFGY